MMSVIDRPVKNQFDYMKHLINRLEFEFACGDEQQAFDVRSTFALTYQEQVVRWIDEICSRHTNENQLLQIDRIEIDLGTINLDSFSDSFSAAFCYGFEKNLVKHFQIDNEIIPGAPEMSVYRLIEEFLQKGTIPWWGEEFSGDANRLFSELLSGNDSRMQLFLYQHRSNKLIWKRLAWQFNTHVHQQIIGSFAELNSAFTMFRKLLISFHSSLPFQGSVDSPTEKTVQQAILENAPLLFERSGDWLPLVRLMEELLFSIQHDKKEKNIAVILAAIDQWKTSLQADTIHNLTREAASDLPMSIFTSPVGPSGELNLTDSRSSHELIFNEEAFSQIFQNSSGENETATRYPVRFAGLVLLGPFLKQFFQELGFIDHNTWANDTMQYKGVHLLHYLASGRKNVFEYELTFEKILCGLAINAPIPLEPDFQEHEWHEADLLLESVIEHWKVLKNTSVTGLRETFLIRDGLLIQKEEGWLLKVERKTLDVLLDNIPWGYSTVGLPWMPQLLFVEW